MLNIIPQVIDINNNINKIIIFSLIFLFCLNKINKPTPELDNSPDIQLPKVIILSKYNSVITTLPAQFGINPISAVIIGDKILLFLVKFMRTDSSIIVFKIIFIIKINNDIFNV